MSGSWKLLERAMRSNFMTSTIVSRCKVHQYNKSASVANLSIRDCNIVAETSHKGGAPCTRRSGLLQHMFLVPIRNSTNLWQVINWRPLNQYLWKRLLNEELLQVVIVTLKPGFEAISINSADAHFHVPIRPSHHKFLRFALAKNSHHFSVLPFWLTIVPHVFTKRVRSAVE